MSLEPPIRYLFSSPDGDIYEIPLHQPLKLPENHPELTLEAYFKAIKSFVWEENGAALAKIIGKQTNRHPDLGAVKEILIRSEKQGALYHVASVELLFPDFRTKSAVSVAVSEIGQRWMHHEFDTLHFLNDTFQLSYLPTVYFKGEVHYRAGGDTKSLTLFLSDWLESYHEWHLSKNKQRPAEKKPGIAIWDLKSGYRFASQDESYALYKQVAKILTHYYNTQDFRQIHPWHHAAGDFVVRTINGAVDVKLTTARKYEPVIVFPAGNTINPLVAITYFFLNLTIKTRLDKFDGVGDIVWAEAFCLPATIEGFFEALTTKQTAGDYHLGNPEDLCALLKAFNQQELKSLLSSLLDLYRMHDSGDFSVVKANLDEHADQLHSAIQSFRL
jgi:hypothetical protein